MIKKEVMVCLVLILGIFLIGIGSATTYCCEKTTGANPAYCQNVDSESKCATGISHLTGEELNVIAASCDTTSFCNSGTCIIQQDGICMSNTPRIVCENAGGDWDEKPKSELDQCQLGCCLIGSQSAFVTKVTCSRMSTYYGVNTSYRPNIKDELTCLASANPGTEGACVYTKDFITTCERTTRQQCQNKGRISSLSDVEFHPGFLCSAPNLGTNCVPTKKTSCDERNDVRFIDGCGNLANIYDSKRADKDTDPAGSNDYWDYWTKIQGSKCGDGKGNKNSAICGDCDFLSGSMCKQKETGEKIVGGTLVGDNFCKNLDCVDYTGNYPQEGNENGKPRHGESWCVTDSKIANWDTPGANDYKALCMNGEVIFYACDPTSMTRQKICTYGVVDENDNKIKDEDENFLNAGCKVNVWQDCVDQTTKEDCENSDVRDCEWKTYSGWEPKSKGDFDFSEELADSAPILKDSEDAGWGSCVPLFPPGFNRNLPEGVISDCAAATTSCYVVRGKTILETLIPGGTSGDCKENCECTEDSWAAELMDICNSLGDCGNKVNYINRQGDVKNALSIDKDIG